MEQHEKKRLEKLRKVVLDLAQQYLKDDLEDTGAEETYMGCMLQILSTNNDNTGFGVRGFKEFEESIPQEQVVIAALRALSEISDDLAQSIGIEDIKFRSQNALPSLLDFMS